MVKGGGLTAEGGDLTVEGGGLTAGPASEM